MMVEPVETMADEYTLKDVVRLIDGLAASTQTSLDRIEGKVDAGFTRIERRLGHIETRIEGVEERVTVLEAQP